MSLKHASNMPRSRGHVVIIYHLWGIRENGGEGGEGGEGEEVVIKIVYRWTCKFYCDSNKILDKQ